MAWIEARKRSDGGTSFLVRWRLGGSRAGRPQLETFGAGSDARNRARAEGFRDTVAAAGEQWPEGWVKDDIRAWLIGWDRSPKTKANYHGLLHGVFAYADDHGEVSENPLRRTAPKRSRIRQSQPDLRFLTEAEFAAVTRAAGPDAELLAAAVGTGLRFGELTALWVGDLDLCHRTLRVTKAWKRDGADGEQDIPAWLRKTLRATHAMRGHHLGNPTTPRSRRTVELSPELAALLRRHTACYTHRTGTFRYWAASGMLANRLASTGEPRRPPPGSGPSSTDPAPRPGSSPAGSPARVGRSPTASRIHHPSPSHRRGPREPDGPASDPPGQRPPIGTLIPLHPLQAPRSLRRGLDDLDDLDGFPFGGRRRCRRVPPQAS